VYDINIRIFLQNVLSSPRVYSIVYTGYAKQTTTTKQKQNKTKNK